MYSSILLSLLTCTVVCLYLDREYHELFIIMYHIITYYLFCFPTYFVILSFCYPRLVCLYLDRVYHELFIIMYHIITYLYVSLSHVFFHFVIVLPLACLFVSRSCIPRVVHHSVYLYHVFAYVSLNVT